MKEKDFEKVRIARKKVDEAFALLKEVWESNANVKSDALGFMTEAPADGEVKSDVPDAVICAMQSMNDVCEYIEEVTG